jgi:hypothetical protein
VKTRAELALEFMHRQYDIKSKELEAARKKLDEANLIVSTYECDGTGDDSPHDIRTCLPCRILRAIA